MTTAPPACPRCQVPVQPDWDWCHACGFHPDDLRAANEAPVAPLPTGATPVPNPPSPHDVLAAPRRREIPVPDEPGRVSMALKVLAVAVVALVAVGAVGYLVLRSGKGNSAPAATPAFTTGLTAFFSTSSPGASAVVLPDDLPGCVEHHLTVGEVAEISTMRRPADASRLSDRASIHVFRAVRNCDLAGAAEVLTAEKNIFSPLGVQDISQQQCVMQHLIGDIAALPDGTTGSMDAQTERALESSFKACVPFSRALASILHLSAGLPVDAAACVADQLDGKVTWSDLFAQQTPQVKARIQAAVRETVPACR